LINNQISLYNKIDESLVKDSGINLLFTGIEYKNNNEVTNVSVQEDYNNVLVMNEMDDNWSPSEYELTLNHRLSIENPKLLFGETGVTMPGNSIGLAAHIYSKTANFQKTVDLFEVTYRKNAISYDFSHHFPVGVLNGKVEFEYFFYLKDVKETYFRHASKKGMVLTLEHISTMTLIVDGDGSAFPITEFEDKEGPLWKLETNWVEPNIEPFNSSTVNLSLNIKHPLFEQVKNGRTQISRAMMGDIMLQAMSLIIIEVIFKDQKNIEEKLEDTSDSILSAVQYWVESFDIDTSSIAGISNSMRVHWDRKMISGGNNDD